MKIMFSSSFHATLAARALRAAGYRATRRGNVVAVETDEREHVMQFLYHVFKNAKIDTHFDVETIEN